MRPVGAQHDDLHPEFVQACEVAGEQIGPAARVCVQRREGGDTPGVPPHGDLALPGAEYRDPLVFGITHGKAPVRQGSDGLRLGELAGTFAAPSQRLHVQPERIEDPDMLLQQVQDVDGPVAGHRDRADVAEEVLLGAIQPADRDLGHERGFGAPDASRKGADHRRVTDGLDDGLGCGAGRRRVGAAGGEEGGAGGQE